MREPPKVVSLASALAALAAPAAAPPIADAAGLEGARVSGETGEGIQTEAETGLPVGAELMSFTVHQTSDGTMFPQHGSHVSHSSHASHVSGVGGGYVPSVPDVPYVPNPVYAPPLVAPPVAPAPVAPPASTSTPPPAYGPDIIRVACTRASNGFGVNDIASELVQLFGISASQAVSIADQALVAVLAGGDFCDGYLE